MNNIEILAPAGGWDSLVAAVRCGANAVYLGGTDLNARHGAKNFDEDTLIKAVSYCHARGVKVHMTVNTVVFDHELRQAETAIEIGAKAGVDAFIIQDLAVAEIAKNNSPDIERHASTQMSVHNISGVLMMAELGFSQVVLARELTLEEIEQINKYSPIKTEVFVHGALCMSVSGQCYLSSTIGGRSGNRGRCAQPCRLPFASESASHSLSLKDLSVIEHLEKLKDAGVTSFKIEGRLKRPEYVAAAVTACQDVLAGKEPDYATLEGVFSRSGFTKGYYDDDLGDHMFGTRTRDDVVSTAATLKELAGLYHQEQPRIPVDMHLEIKPEKEATLKVIRGSETVTVLGEKPQIAKTAPTTYERAYAAMDKTGGTPFYLSEFSCDITDGYMMPVSQLNSLRRNGLDSLLEKLETPASKSYTPFEYRDFQVLQEKDTAYRIRLEHCWQYSEDLFNYAENIILPTRELLRLEPEQLEKYKGRFFAQLPRLVFRSQQWQQMVVEMEHLSAMGISDVLTGDYGGFRQVRDMGFNVHGDFGLNVTNYMSASIWKNLGMKSLTLSMEYPITPESKDPSIAVGVLAYGYLPMMIFRNSPAGLDPSGGDIIDRLGHSFRVMPKQDSWEMYNTVPTYLGDMQYQFKTMDFLTLYFTEESPEHVLTIAENFKSKKAIPKPYTRGLYSGKVK